MRRYTEQINGKWVITAERDNTIAASGDGNKLKSVSGASIDHFAELEDKIESGRIVELPYAPDCIDVGFTQLVRSVRDDLVALRTPIYISVKKDTLEEASAMLKELEQNAAERDDNADAIIYGLRTVIGALKADKNSDER